MMVWMNHLTLRHPFTSRSVVALMAFLACLRPSFGAPSYATDFRLEKRVYLVGEPVLCDFIIRNTGTEAFAFPYRTPTRALNPMLASEPRFLLTDAHGHRLPEALPHPCGGAKGRAVYGSVTLPPGQTSVEPWVLNQWGTIASPGLYRVHAERHLPLYAVKAHPGTLSGPPIGYALAVENLSFKVEPGTPEQLRAAYRPLINELQNPRNPRFSEAVVAVTAVPHSFLEPQLRRLLSGEFARYPWVPEQALNGLARLGTPSAWQTILNVALGHIAASGPKNETLALRSYAILLLAEKGDAGFVPPLISLLHTAPEPLQQNILPALGFFHDPRANEALFQRLRSPIAADRANAILGLKNLNSRNVIPALLAMLKDPDEEVRTVANFALQSLTGQGFALPPLASPSQLARAIARWNKWWQDNNESFRPAPQAPCRDW